MMSLGVLAGMAGDCDVLREPIAVAKTLGGSRIFKRLFLCVFIFPPRTVTALAAPAGYGSRFLADFSCQIINLPQRHFSRSNIREWIETCLALPTHSLLRNFSRSNIREWIETRIRENANTRRDDFSRSNIREWIETVHITGKANYRDADFSRSNIREWIETVARAGS